MQDWLGTTPVPPAPFGTVTIRGKRFRVEFSDAISERDDANVDPPGTPHRTIWIRPHIAHDPQYFLEIMLHEALHGAFWDLSEEAVSETAKDLAILVARTLAYRPETQ
jgi:hypothetical protein